MDAGVMDLCDEIEALKAEIRRIRAAAGHVIDKSFCLMGHDSGDLGELRKATRKLVIEIDRFAPSMALNSTRKKAPRR